MRFDFFAKAPACLSLGLSSGLFFLTFFLMPLFVQATPPSPSKSTPTEPPTTSSSQKLTPSMQVLWRLHQDQLRLVETNVIYKGNKKLELTFLGGGYEQIFQGSPKSLKLMSNFHALQIGGFVLSSLGMGATIAGTLIIIITPQAVVQPAAGGIVGPELFWGLLLGGTAFSLVGSILAQSSYGLLYRAVDIYNREVFEKAFREANGGKIPQASRSRSQKRRSILYAATN